MQINITKTELLKPKPDDDKLSFGTLFTDYMFNMDYDPEKGWHDARIEPYGDIAMDPAAMVLHYGQGIFEGLKAYRTETGAIQLFRPRENIKRFNRSCRRMCMPEIDVEFAIASLKSLVTREQDWVPRAPQTALYIRPTMIATDPYLGVRASHTYRYFIILSPVGAYYAEGFNPVKIWVTDDYVRAVRGGVGEAKTIGNYAASLLAAETAQQKGYTQVLWLDGVERKYIEEVGTMNIFAIIGDEIITPRLTGSILPGVTRNSVVELLKMWNLKVSERKLSIDEVMAAHKAGDLKEIFGTGTAAVISPVGELCYRDQVIRIADGGVGPTAKRLFETLQQIQYGSVEDPAGWIEPVC